VILVDTSVWIELLSGRTRVRHVESKLTDFVTCPPVVQEILQGFSDRASYQVFEDQLLAFPCLSEPVPLDLYVKAATIYREGRSRGYTIRSAIDCLIAAVAWRRGATLLAQDVDLQRVAR